MAIIDYRAVNIMVNDYLDFYISPPSPIIYNSSMKSTIILHVH